MLEVLVYLLLQLGLTGDLTSQQQPLGPTPPAETTVDSILQKPVQGTVTTTTSTTGIGGSGWDDKN